MTSPLDHIPDLAACLAAAGLDELDLTGPDGHVRLRRGGAGEREPVPNVSLAAPLTGRDGDGHEVIASPGVGHFLHAHPLRETPLVRPDEPVVAGQPIGLLRVGTLLRPVPAPRDGIVRTMIAADGTLVGYGDPLLAFWPAEG